MRILSVSLVCYFLALFGATNQAIATSLPTLTKVQLAAIGAKIYQNETGSNPDHLIAWNNGESFASLGIGHFIWFPKDLNSPFTETFPSLLQYLKAQNVAMPTWLRNQEDFPWQTKSAYVNARQGTKMQALRSLLKGTFEHQVNFIYQRMRAALPLMLEKIPHAQDKQLIRTRFEALAASELGMYSLIDYVNFKGEGTSATEQYKGQGWGLLQVLQNMQTNSTNIHLSFSQACDTVLSTRVRNSTQQSVEKKWLPGWRKRCATYAK